MKKIITGLVAAAALAAPIALAAGSASAAPTTVYDAIPNPMPSNVPSLGMEAYSMDEIGDHIRLAEGTTTLDSMTVTMSSFACEDGNWNQVTCYTTPGTPTTPGPSFSHPVTVNLYNVDTTTPGAPQRGTLLESFTETFAMPYRPSADPACGTGWMAPEGCMNGFAFPITFDLDGLAVPAEIIYGISYNTNNHGPEPIEASDADSLNVGLLTTGAPTVGVDVDDDVVFVDSTYPGMDTGDTFGPNSGWAGWTPAVEFSTVPAPELTVENCKNGGYMSHGFKNQGQCIASVVANEASGK